MDSEKPTDEIFEEMRKVATQIWEGYDNAYGYVTEKLSRINSFENIQDNAMVFYRMFDWHNQARMKQMLSSEAVRYIEVNG